MSDQHNINYTLLCSDAKCAAQLTEFVYLRYECRNTVALYTLMKRFNFRSFLVELNEIEASKQKRIKCIHINQ